MDKTGLKDRIVAVYNFAAEEQALKDLKAEYGSDFTTRFTRSPRWPIAGHDLDTEYLIAVTSDTNEIATWAIKIGYDGD